MMVGLLRIGVGKMIVESEEPKASLQLSVLGVFVASLAFWAGVGVMVARWL
jgi:hypothetical protein